MSEAVLRLVMFLTGLVCLLLAIGPKRLSQWVDLITRVIILAAETMTGSRLRAVLTWTGAVTVMYGVLCLVLAKAEPRIAMWIGFVLGNVFTLGQIYLWGYFRDALDHSERGSFEPH